MNDSVLTKLHNSKMVCACKKNVDLCLFLSFGEAHMSVPLYPSCGSLVWVATSIL